MKIFLYNRIFQLRNQHKTLNSIVCKLHKNYSQILLVNKSNTNFIVYKTENLKKTFNSIKNKTINSPTHIYPNKIMRLIRKI